MEDNKAALDTEMHSSVLLLINLVLSLVWFLSCPQMENIGDDTVAVVMLSRLKSAVCDYITSFIPYTQLFTAPQPREKDLHTLRGVTLSNLGIKLAPLKEMGPMCLNMSQDYNDVLGRFTTQICKSTTCK